MPKPEFRSTEELLSSIIRVDHAGEYGAMRIYQGQMAAIKDPQTKALISHMQEQEQEHLSFFEKEMKLRKVRPTALLPLWHYGAYALGFMTALMGKRTAMLCTQAVEEVIDEHYIEQISELESDKNEAELLAKIEQYRAEELEHKDMAIDHGSMEAPFYVFVRKAIRGLCKGAIEISKRV